MRTERGFSLIEMMVVLVIVGVISALAIPGLRRARQNANAGSAIQTLRMITTAQHLYERKSKKYGTLADLAPEGTIDTNVAMGYKSDYNFVLTLLPDSAGRPDMSFTCTATPASEAAKRPHFFVDESGVIRFEDGVPADGSSPPIPR
jgi:prepilin-type N-terminal cleavage/methylation domain-containing protein